MMSPNAMLIRKMDIKVLKLLWVVLKGSVIKKNDCKKH